MSAPLLDRRDIDFQLFTWLGADSLADRATIEAFLDLSEKLATEQFLPLFKRCDVEEPRLVDGEVLTVPEIRSALAKYAELGLPAAGFAVEQGGLGGVALVEGVVGEGGFERRDLGVQAVEPGGRLVQLALLLHREARLRRHGAIRSLGVS